jgi:hypothetical protein
MQLTDSPASWRRYVERLRALAVDKSLQELEERDLCRTWAIGTEAWREALAREHSHRALALDFPADEMRGLRENRWIAVWQDELNRRGLRPADVIGFAVAEKIELAMALRRNAGACYRWIASTLGFGSPLALRVAVCRQRQNTRPESSSARMG